MPFSSADTIELFRRGREQMLRLALGETLPVRALTIAQALRSLGNASLFACLLDGVVPHATAVDDKGDEQPAWTRDTAKCRSLTALLRAAKISVITAPIALGTRQFGELGLGWRAQADAGAGDRQVLEHALAACGQWLAARLCLEELGKTPQPSDGPIGLAAVNELIGPLIHEFNNFLNTIALQLAVFETKMSAQALGDLHVIRKHSDAVARVIRQFQRYRDEQRSPQQPLDLNEAVRSAALAWHRRRAPGAGGATPLAEHEVRHELAPDLPPVAGVRQEVHCLVHFLLSRVSASLPADRRALRIRTERDVECIRLRIDGGGATPDDDSGTAVENDETLEVAACRALVRRLYGKMQTRWTADGLAVTIELPSAAS